MLKPDTVRRKLIGRIIQRFEDKGLEIVEMKMLKIPKELAEKLYEEHKDKEFFLVVPFYFLPIFKYIF